MKTGSWFSPVPPDHIKVGISRGVPRNLGPGFLMYRKLAPGPWFNDVDVDEYCERYAAEILAPLDPAVVVADLMKMAAGRVPILCCFEKADRGQWCHRSLAAAWIGAYLGEVVPEVNFEHLPQDRHPLRPPAPTPRFL
jgi:hypothetical protein